MISKVLLAFALLLIGGWLVTLYVAGQNERAAEASHPPEGQLLDVDGVQVHAVVQGEGPDVVLIHGSSANTRDFTFSLSNRLAERYRVITFDRPGLGYTDSFNPKGESITEQADLLARAAAQLGADNPIVLGQSYGGGVALAWGVTKPEQAAGLVVVAGVSHPWDTGLPTFYQITSSWWGQRFAIPLMTAWVPQSYIDTSVQGAFAPHPMPEGYQEHFGPRLSARREALRANARQRANLKAEIRALLPRYAELSMPIELIHAPDDTVVPIDVHARPFVEKYPDARLTEAPGTGHMPHHLAEDLVVEAIDRIAAQTR